jgi:hypothetical protein
MERAGSVIGKEKRLASAADPQKRACAAWAQAVGPKVAKYTRAVALVRGRLMVEIDDFTWQVQIPPIQHFILRNLAKALGEVVVTDLDLRYTPPRRLPQSAATARPAHSGPQDPERIQDPVLAMLYRRAKRGQAG